MADEDDIKEEITNENILGEKSEEIQRVSLVSSSPSARSIVRVVVIVLLLLAVKDFLGLVIGSLTFLFFMIVLAIFLAYLINPLVELIRRPFAATYPRMMPKSLAIGVAFLIVFATVSIAVYYLSPAVTQQARRFAENVPSYTQGVQNAITDMNRRLDRMRIPDSVQTQVNDRINVLLGATGTFITTILGLSAIYAITYLPWLILVPILAFFFLKDAQLFKLALLRMVPVGDWRSRVDSVVADINNTLNAYAKAQLISCFLIGVVCTIGFYIIGNDYALLLGILAAVLELIPLLGPLTLAILATTVSGFESGLQAVTTALFLALLRIVQDYFIYPRIIREGIHLHPLAVILSVLAGEQVAGIPGVFIAIPLVALLTVLYKHILEHTSSSGLFTGLLEPKENKEIAEGK
ncbi:MAG TPA: AI-2E family transporter [Pyrinomonadaceae bacterium]|nr:AI-2E family transporter [Pyrinomonadaceae bacterium]